MNAVNIFSLRNLKIKHADIIPLLKCQFFRKTIAFPSHLHSITCSISNLWKWRKDNSLPDLLPLSCTFLEGLLHLPYSTFFPPSRRLLINFCKENKICALRVKQNEINAKMFQFTSVLNNGIPLVQILTFSLRPTWIWYNWGNISLWKKKALHKMWKKIAANY